MAHTDNTMPWRLREVWAEENLGSAQWFRILNTQMSAWGRRETRRWWHSERSRTRTRLRDLRYASDTEGWDVPPSRTRHSVRWDMW